MATSYFNRTLGTSTSRRIYTMSTWVKRCLLSNYAHIYSFGPNPGDFNYLRFNNSNQLNVGLSGDTYVLTTNALYRDVSAWYHIVCAIDTTQATSSNRVKLYINGEQITSFASSSYPTQNLDTNFTSGVTMRIGSSTWGTNELIEGNLASTYLIDGQALTPSSFGETDATTGIWKPKSYTGSYGTNGFFLKFENSGSLGLDSSGNGNNFTVNGTPTQTVDTPSNVFCTLNPLDGLPSGSGGGATVTYSNGNTRSDSRYGAGEYPLCRGNMAVNKGKWYWEAKVDTTGIGVGAGVRSETANGGDFRGGETFYNAGFSGHASNATFEKYDNSGSISIATDVSNGGGVIGYALNLDTGTFAIYYNGTLQGTDTTLPSNNSVYFYPVAGGTNSGSNSWSPISFNFGNGYFATTAISSPYSDGAGLGKFQYQPPTGYYALCTKNINVYG